MGRDTVIGVISDTHGLLRPEAVEALRGVSHILHAGDVGREGVLDALRALAPVTAIRGNVDTAPWADALPGRCRLTLGGMDILMVHDVADAGPDGAGADVVIFGHSHKPVVERRGGQLWLNPGAAGPRRFRLPVTLALLRPARPEDTGAGGAGGAGAQGPDARIVPLPV